MSIIQATKKLALDILFPITCVNCGTDGAWLCDKCLAAIKLISFQVCPLCEKIITEKGKACQKCRPFSALDSLVAAVKYKENNLDKIIHLYKYRFIEDLHIPLGKLLVKNILSSKISIPDVILPVPLHSRRLRWRGFNQSALLADYVSKNLTPGFEIPLAENILRRKRYTPPQMKIKKYAERKNNLRDAFTLNDALPIQKKTVLLVDDIATTGATLFECAKILKLNGAKKVFATVIARQEMG